MEKFIGKKVLVRSSQAGVYFGTLEKINGDSVVMTNVRNIWSWNGATCLSQIANEGIQGGKVSQEVAEMGIIGVCQIIPLTPKALDNLYNQPLWKV